MFPIRTGLGLLLILPFLEILVIARVGRVVGFAVVALWILAAALLGARILRSHSWSIWHQLRRALDTGEAPGAELLEATVAMAGGVLLIIPGFITDVAALLCLSPPSRKWLVERLVRRLQHSDSGFAQNEERSRTIDGEFRRED